MRHTKKERPRKTGYDKEFPVRLRLLMKATKTTQIALAESLGITRQSVAAYCDGTSTPSWEGIAGIARFFGCSSDYLLGLEDLNTAEEETIPVSLDGRSRLEISTGIALSREEADTLKDLIKEKLLQWSQGQEGDPEQAKLLTGIYLRL